MSDSENREANEFARQLLMPEFMVHEWMKTHSGYGLLRRFALAFEVSEGLAGARLMELGYDPGCG